MNAPKSAVEEAERRILQSGSPQSSSVPQAPYTPKTCVLAQNGDAGRRIVFCHNAGMSACRTHHYRTQTTWTGNLGSGTSSYTAYSRNYDLNAAKKSAPISGSSDPMFRGDATRYNPEELLLGAISSCHMLWVLHLCADAGIVIMAYVDEAEAEMAEHPDGSGEFTCAVLRPRMTITDASRIQDAVDLHHRAHELCALARSMAFPVAHEPQVVCTADLVK